MSSLHVVALAPGVRLQQSPDGAPILVRDEPARGEWRLTPLGGVLVALLVDGPVSYDAIARVAGEVGGEYGIAEWYITLPRLLADGVVHLSVADERGPLITLSHLLDARVIDLPPIDRDASYILSRFAFLHGEHGRSMLTSAVTAAELSVQHPAVAMLLHLMREGGTAVSWAGRAEGMLTSHAVDAVAVLLLASGVLVPMRHGHGEERDALAEWELADALLHHRSRLGRHRDAVGSVYPFKGVRPPAGAIKPPMATCSIPLAPVDLESVARSELSFTTVLEQRQSLRRHGDALITVAQLGEWLYRAARVRAPITSHADSYDTTSRPYPGGGAAYELEVYVVVGCCDGLSRGLYHYAPERHCLEVLDVAETHVRAWLTDTRMPVEAWGERQVLILITARFRRVTWKYRAIAYATVLKDVGVLLQTMSLVATAMGLAACPLGAGDGTRLARAIGADYFEESTVGELTLGARASES